MVDSDRSRVIPLADTQQRIPGPPGTHFIIVRVVRFLVEFRSEVLSIAYRPGLLSPAVAPHGLI